ncbi:MAG TPA: hypothetical protein VIK17_01615, partial [Cellulomonas sp.]
MKRHSATRWISLRVSPRRRARYLTTHGTGQLAMASGVVHGFSVAIWWAVGFLLAARTVVDVPEERVPVLVCVGTYSGGSVASAS